MPERHITDEEIHQASGHAPRVPAGVPRATCLNCGVEYPAFYACMAHDCYIDLKDRRSYGEWLRFFQHLGYGVLQAPDDAKFPFDFVITGRMMLTEFLQSNIYIAMGHELQPEYYNDPKWEKIERKRASQTAE